MAAVILLEMLTVLWARGRFSEEAFPVPERQEAGYSNTQAVGEWLYTQHLLPFEVAGIILLVAIIAAIALTLRKRTDVKTQDPSRQVRVKRDERVRLVKMKSETPAGGER